jgi:hypothetical protein
VNSNDHTHPELEDRITAEMALVRTELATRIAEVNARIDLHRQETRRGFADLGQVLGQILARLPEPGDGR